MADDKKNNPFYKNYEAEQLQNLYDRVSHANIVGKEQFDTHKQLMNKLKENPEILKNFQDASSISGFSGAMRGKENEIYLPDDSDYLKVKKHLKNDTQLSDLVKKASERFDFSDLIRENKPQPELYDDALKSGSFWGEDSMPQEDTDELGRAVGRKSFTPTKNNSFENLKKLINKRK